MAHFVVIEDTQGELVDLEVYCSDNCAQSSSSYAGWYGCMEVEFDTQCSRLDCENTLAGAMGAYAG
jgi:hypothetical protein